MGRVYSARNMTFFFQFPIWMETLFSAPGVAGNFPDTWRYRPFLWTIVLSAVNGPPRHCSRLFAPQGTEWQMR